MNIFIFQFFQKHGMDNGGESSNYRLVIRVVLRGGVLLHSVQTPGDPQAPRQAVQRRSSAADQLTFSPFSVRR